MSMISILVAATAVVLMQEPASSAKIVPVAVGQSPNSAVFETKVYFAGQPAQADFAEYAKLGVKQVINLRTPAEMEKVGFSEVETAKAAGLEYLNVPMSSEPPSDADLQKIYAALKLSTQGDGKVLLHCASSNRAGLVWTLYRGSEQGLSVDEAVAEGKAAGMKNPNFEKLARQRLQK